jgi:sarcosine oxidase subunit alpha
MQRIKDHRIYLPDERAFDRGEPVRLRFEGYRLRGFTHEPVAVALYAMGVRIAARSLKYHRPRGLFCLAGRCMSCLARVGGVPNVRTCHVTCRDGMTIRRENAVPQATDDLLHTMDFAFPKHLNYHEMLTQPAWINRLVQQNVRRFSGTGDLPDKPNVHPPIREQSVEVAVIGGGPAGMAAARAAAEAGAKVLLIEDLPELGGHFVGWPEPVDGQTNGPAWVRTQRDALQRAGVEILTRAECIAHYREGFWAVHQNGGLVLLTAKRAIVATGAYDQPPLFANNDLPDIFSARGLLKLINRWGVCPAVSCTIIGTDAAALALAEGLPQIGVRVLGLVTERTRVEGDPDRAEKIQSRGIPIFLGYRVTKAIGTFHLKGLRLEPVGGGEPVDARCDLVCVSTPPAPSWELAAQAGAEPAYQPERHGFIVRADAVGRTTRSDLFVTGEMRGAAKPATIIARGRAAGLTAALDLHPDDARQAELAALTEAAAHAG